ncbi:MAG: magnesium chelatase subunit D [Sphingomonas sp.]
MTALGAASPGAATALAPTNFPADDLAGPPDPLADAVLAIRLAALDPAGLGGLVARGVGLAEEALLAALASALPAGAPVRRMPAAIDDEQLVGGLDLGATLSRGTRILRTGLLAAAHGGAVVIPMAERLDERRAAPICAALDCGEIGAERASEQVGDAARFIVLALDEGRDADDRVPDALTERLAFAADLSAVRLLALNGDDLPARRPIPVAHVAPPTVAVLEALAAVAHALGVESARALLFAMRAARASAALAGRAVIEEADVALAARLVLGPRATRLPAPPALEQADPPPDQHDAPPPDDPQASDQNSEATPPALDDIVLEAVLASLPRDVLAQIAAGHGRPKTIRGASGRGERRKALARGKPVGVRAGPPRGGLRLSLVDTLRAAAPWQKLRPDNGSARVKIRRDDLRVYRFETRAQALTIFAVDASGSAAFARLAEAKGAVELLLAEAYVHRAQVALIIFRGPGAQLVLPPTRSLARAKRALADVPGGGATPLADGLVAAGELAASARTRGMTPFIVVLTDGRANMTHAGVPDRATAYAEAQAAATLIAVDNTASAFIDISARPRAEGADIASAMGARYVALPRADSHALHSAIKGAR